MCRTVCGKGPRLVVTGSSPPSVMLLTLDDLNSLPSLTACASPVRCNSDVGPVMLSHCRAPLVLNSTRLCTAWPLEQQQQQQ